MRSDTTGGGGVADLDEFERLLDAVPDIATHDSDRMRHLAKLVGYLIKHRRELHTAARREQEARALVVELVEADQYVFCCGSWPHDGRRPHAPDCAWGKARAWLAAKS